MRGFLPLLLAGAVASCGSCADEPLPPPAEPRQDPPVPLPDGVLADIDLASPDASWKKAQATVGGLAALMPSTFGGVLSVVIGGDAQLGAQVDGTWPAHALIVGDPAHPRVILAAHLLSPSGARSALADGDAARFKRAGTEALIDVFEGAAPEGGAGWVLGLAHGGFLVAAPSRADLAAYGPYEVRTAPTRPAPDGALRASIPHAAIVGPLHAWFEAQRSSASASLSAMDDAMRKDHGGRAPDFGDPRALLAALARVSGDLSHALSDVDQADVRLDVGEAGITFDATLAPGPVGSASRTAFSALPVGDVEPVLRAPSGAVATVLWRTDAAGRMQSARDTTDLVRSTFGDRVAVPVTTQLATNLEALARARGDWMLASLSAASPRGIALTCRVGDDVAALKSLGGVCDATTRGSLGGVLREALGVQSLKDATTEVHELGRTRVVTVARPASAHSLLGAEFGLAFGVKEGVLGLGLGAEASSLARGIVAPLHRIGDDARVASAVQMLGTDASVVAVLVPGALAAAPRSDAAVVAIGRKADAGWVHVVSSPSATRQFVSLAMKGL